MTIHIRASVSELWLSTVQGAEERSAIMLSPELESYLVSLLIRYMDHPEIAQQIVATTFLNAQAKQAKAVDRVISLQGVGDQCLLYAGLFPKVAERRHVKINYYVDLGRSAYAGIAKNATDLFWTLALRFVPLMDVLQSIRLQHDMLPLEAYEQWESLGSKRALQILREYSQGFPHKDNNHHD